ncbi:hypothetical protein [Intrasporangium sp.]|uniref:hypothetical protein n=1 Tax=Intrasporangium sp. TaxID=1925024 RepID=UPI00293A7B8E|nr:hypothetical protein [Intrasporangium sp.]MDV3219823.1 hypothetical protein [Intrasporangium sp.]
MELEDFPDVPRFNRGDRVMLDLSPLLEPLGEDAAQRDRDAQTRMAAVHGSLGTVVRGDDTRNAIERLIHRVTGRPAATVRVDWDGTDDEPVGRRRRRQRPYLTQVVFRSQLRHADVTRPASNPPPEQAPEVG